MAPRPSICANPDFNAKASAEMLRNAMKGLGCNNAKVVQAMCTCNNRQRQEISIAYKSFYGRDLTADLKDELKSDFERLVVAMMAPPADYDAEQLHSAMTGLGTKESVLIEIMATRTNAQLAAVKSSYKRLYNKELEAHLISETSGDFQRLLVSLACGNRDQSLRVDPLSANQDARKLYTAGEQRLGTDESAFNAVLATRNYHQLRAIFDEYQKITTRPLEQAVANEFGGDIRDAMLAIVKFVRHAPTYFAELINNSMKGLGTRDSDLIRLIVTRSEIDLADIRDAYQKLYNTSLEKAIAGDCSGSYKEALISLVKGNC